MNLTAAHAMTMPSIVRWHAVPGGWHWGNVVVPSEMGVQSVTFYEVRRTSLFSDDVPPCPYAASSEFTYVDRRSVNDPTKIPAYRDEDPAWWYSEGTNHRVDHGQICRDFVYKRWVVEVESLLVFVRNHGRIVLSSGDPDRLPILAHIEIYDGYRE